MSHQAIIAKIDKIVEIPGARTIVQAFVLGTPLIVDNKSKEGDVGILFPSELKLSEDYCKENNLYRHSNLNKDNTKTGFFEDNRRVRCQPFMKIKSDGYFAPIESLSYLKADLSKLKVGDMFDKLDGKEICCKYVNEATLKMLNRQNKQQKKRVNIEVKNFPPHKDTEQLKYYIHSIPKNSLITIGAKLHGTSFRAANTKIIKHLPLWKKLINKVRQTFITEYWDYVCGTRRVVLKTGEEEKEGFHGSESFRFDCLNVLKPYLEKNLVIYGEQVGYANGKELMPSHETSKLKNQEYEKKYGKVVHFNYGCQTNECKFYIYRLCLVGEDGLLVDFSPAQIEDWCIKRNLNFTPTIHPTFIYDGNQENLLKLVEELTERPALLTQDYINPFSISEGIIVRCDNGNLQPTFFKNKSWAFKVGENIIKENEKVLDLEDVS
jgi:hypothetical protein